MYNNCFDYTYKMIFLKQKYYILLYLILVSFYISYSNALESINLTPPEYNQRYASGGTCQLTFIVLFSDPSGILQFDQVYPGGSATLESNTTAKIIRVNSNVNIGANPITFTITTGNNEQKTVSFGSYICEILPNLSFALLTSITPLTKTIYFQVNQLNRYTNPSLLNVDCTGSVLCTIGRTFGNVYSVGILYPTTISATTFTMKIDLESYTETFTFNFPLTNPTEYSLNNIKTYPSTGSNLGYFSSFITFDFYSSDATKLSYLISNKKSYPIPIYGSPYSNTTFYSQFIDYTNPSNEMRFYPSTLNGQLFGQYSATLTVAQQYRSQPQIDLKLIQLANDIFYLKYITTLGKESNSEINFYFNDRSRELKWPYGYSFSNSSYFDLQLGFPVYKSTFDQTFELTIIDTKTISVSVFEVESDPPFIKSLEMIPMNNTFGVFLRIHITDQTGFSYISDPLRRLTLISKSNLVSGTITDGWYEKFIDFGVHGYISAYRVCDIGQNCELLTQVPRLNQSTYFPTVIQVATPPRYQIKFISITFEKNNIDLTNKACDNIMYVQMSNPITTVPPAIALPFTTVSGDEKILYDIGWFSKGVWNASASRYEVPFTLPMNMYTTSSVRYSISYLNQIFYSDYIISTLPNSKLSVHSDNADTFGPTIIQLTPFPNNAVPIHNDEITSFGWELAIQDKLNGFRNGNVTIEDSYGVLYFFEFDMKNSTGPYQSTLDTFVFRLQLSIAPTCISQSYKIKSIYLYDNAACLSTYGVDETRDAMMNFNIDTFQITIYCNYPHPTDNVPPLLKSFTVSSTSLDVSSSQRKLDFELIVQDPLSGLNQYSMPIIYLQALNFDLIQCKTTYKVKNSAESSYNCSIQVPLLFGYPEGILLSVYGMVDLHANYRGYSSVELKEASFQYFIQTTIVNGPFQPIVESTSTIGLEGGILHIYGSMFGLGGSLVFLDLMDGLPISILTPFFETSSMVSIEDIPPLTKPFKIQVGVSTLKSNEFIVTPIGYVPEEPSSESSSDSQNEICLNDCGGSERGECTSNGCKCYLPWTGIDCKSKITQVDPPETNTTSPSVDIILNNSNIKFKGSVSVIALIERSPADQIVNEYPIDLWAYSSSTIDSIENNNYAKILVNKNDQSNVNLNVTTQFFTQDKNITFANLSYLMNQYTMKFSINITKYTFQSTQNYLQVVMAASMSADTSDSVCSDQEYGKLSNSEYFKLQVDDHSLFGKFIKRGIIDSRIETVSNTFLNDSFITKPKESSTLIGINVRYYQQSVQLDPDFSILLELKKADNSCDSTKSGLTKAQLAGIIVAAGVVFVALVIICVFLVFKRFKYSAPIIKMRQIGKKNKV